MSHHSTRLFRHPVLYFILYFLPVTSIYLYTSVSFHHFPLLFGGGGCRLSHPMGAVWRFRPPPIPSIRIHVFCSCCHSTKSMFTSIVTNLSFVIIHPYNYCIKLVICNEWPIQSITGFASWSGSQKRVMALLNPGVRPSNLFDVVIHVYSNDMPNHVQVGTLKTVWSILIIPRHKVQYICNEYIESSVCRVNTEPTRKYLVISCWDTPPYNKRAMDTQPIREGGEGKVEFSFSTKCFGGYRKRH